MMFNSNHLGTVAPVIRAQATSFLIAAGGLFAVMAGLPAAAQTASNSPVGLWRNIDDKTSQPKAEIRISSNATGVLTGVIEKSLIKPVELTCSMCTDDRKDKPKMGMEIIRGAVKAEGKDIWEGGKILDPENGKNYTLRLTPVEGGSKLEVRGAIGPFGRTQTWVRVQ